MRCKFFAWPSQDRCKIDARSLRDRYIENPKPLQSHRKSDSTETIKGARTIVAIGANGRIETEPSDSAGERSAAAIGEAQVTQLPASTRGGGRGRGGGGRRAAVNGGLTTAFDERAKLPSELFTERSRRPLRKTPRSLCGC